MNTLIQYVVEAPLVVFFLPFVLKVMKTVFVGLPDEESTEETPSQPIKPAEDGWFSFDERLLEDYDPRDE